MNRSAFTIFAAAGAVAIISAGCLFAQDPDDSDSPSALSPTPPPVRYKYSEMADPLKMLQEIKAANDEVLAKQKAFLNELDRLAKLADANKASAHLSTMRAKKYLNQSP